LLGAETVSLAGSRVTFLAVPWLVLETTGSAAQTGLVTFAEMAPYVGACALGGPLVDRRGPRWTSIATDVASAGTIALVPVLFRADLLPFGLLVVVMAAAGGLRGLGDTAKRTLFPSAVEASEVDLTRAASIRDGTSRLAEMLAPRWPAS
jgi:MFS family permease